MKSYAFTGFSASFYTLFFFELVQLIAGKNPLPLFKYF